MFKYRLRYRFGPISETVEYISFLSFVLLDTFALSLLSLLTVSLEAQ